MLSENSDNYVDVEHDQVGQDKTMGIIGNKSIQDIAFSDGSRMVEPSDIDLKKKLEEISVL